jgi:small subunit ribosomal protein S6
VTNIAIVRDYETLYIVDPNLNDEQIQAVIEKYSNLVKQEGGEVISAERWDKRRLAYEVAGRREGIYILMYFNAEPAVESELNRVMRISEDVMRHIIVRAEPSQVAEAKERKSKPAPKPVEAPAPEATAAETAAEPGPETAKAEAEAVAEEAALPEQAEEQAVEQAEEQASE